MSKFIYICEECLHTGYGNWIDELGSIAVIWPVTLCVACDKKINEDQNNDESDSKSHAIGG